MPQDAHQHPNPLISRLRQEAPPLRPHDPQRVNRLCDRLTAEPRPARRAISAPLLRRCALVAAAATLLLLGLPHLLMRPRAPVVGATASCGLRPVIESLESLWNALALEEHLAGETRNLAADLADLTTVINDQTFAILF